MDPIEGSTLSSSDASDLREKNVFSMNSTDSVAFDSPDGPKSDIRTSSRKRFTYEMPPNGHTNMLSPNYREKEL
eukprot:8901303-Ditylum_brightwellii.AAC.1